MSYEIVGALFRAYNKLGPGLRERHYQRALAEAFRLINVPFREQVGVALDFEGKLVGRYFVDFLIAERVVLEIKQGDFCSVDHLLQVKRYLGALGLRLGILANFGSRRVVYRRVLVGPKTQESRMDANVTNK
ncbi:MAG: GxxExxY protein [Candidatus Uhrbacteria bacterium]